MIARYFFSEGWGVICLIVSVRPNVYKNVFTKMKWIAGKNLSRGNILCVSYSPEGMRFVSINLCVGGKAAGIRDVGCYDAFQG